MNFTLILVLILLGLLIIFFVNCSCIGKEHMDNVGSWPYAPMYCNQIERDLKKDGNMKDKYDIWNKSPADTCRVINDSNRLYCNNTRTIINSIDPDLEKMDTKDPWNAKMIDQCGPLNN